MKHRALALLAALLAASPASATTPAETSRIREHLLGAEREMEARDVSHLSAAQRGARGRALAALRRYRLAGRFPHNHVLPGARTPVFVDEHGTPCAMAYLIGESGSRELVRRVASTRNLALIRQLADDGEVVAWLSANGITAAEAARVQPQYTGEVYDEEEDFDNFADDIYRVSTTAFTLSNAGLMYLNVRRADSPPLTRLWGGLAVASGALQAVAGAGGLSDGDMRPYGAFNLGFGAATVAMGARSLLRPDSGSPLQRQVRLPSGQEGHIAATPLATTDGGFGLAATLRF